MPNSELTPTQLPAPEQQAGPPPATNYPLAYSLTPGVEYTFTSAAGYGFTAVYQSTQASDGCLKVKTKDGIDGFVNPMNIAVVVLAAVSARA